MQSEMFDAAFGSDASLAVSAPTGAGKTVIFDLALCRLQVTAGAVDASGRFMRRAGAPKAVFIAPLRVRWLMQFHTCSSIALRLTRLAPPPRRPWSRSGALSGRPGSGRWACGAWS